MADRTVHKSPLLAQALVIISSLFLIGCAGSQQIKPLNTLKKIDRPVVAYQDVAEPDIILQRHTAEFLFAPGNYSAFDANDALRAVVQLNQYPGPRTLTVEGYSYSRGNSASEQLALKRSQVVVDALVLQGIDPRTIQQVGIYANQVSEESPFCGAKLIWVSAAGSVKKILPAAQILGVVTPGGVAAVGGKPNNSVVADTDHPIAPKADQAEIAPIPYTLTLNKGSLRANLTRIVEDHGYTLVLWELGDEDEYIDWILPKTFTYEVTGGIEEVLRSLQKLYGVQGNANSLDKTVDFTAGNSHE